MDTRHIEVVVPASGVRAWFDAAGRVVVHATDDGAHGKPWAALLLPVRRTRGVHLSLSVADGRAATQFDAGVLFRHALWVPLAIHTGSYVLTLEHDLWPAEGEHVLLLLVCLRSSGQRHLPARAVNPQDPSRPPAGCEDQVVQAVGELLQHSTWGALRAGLIEQAPALPAEAQRTVCFALASCNYPCDILDHMPDDEEARWGPADHSLLALGALLDQRAGERTPTLLVLAGDQVYVDATAGLFDPKLRDDKFRIAYERLFASRGAKAVLQRLGLDVEMLLDDHEISDNWEPADLPRDPAEKSNRDFGIEAYWKFQRGVDGAPDMDKPLWRARSHRGLSFFLGDTRTERETRSAANFTRQRIMKERQRLALFKWLVNPALDGRPRFVVTPSMLLPRHVSVANDPATALHSDAWEGHPQSMHALLKHICDNAVQHLVFLSGDEHLSCAVQVELSNTAAATPITTTFHSIHGAALYAPYPFANSAPADFICDESFAFPVPPCGPPGPYVCRVSKLHMRSGDGFVLIAASRVDDGWLFDVDFHTTSPARLFIPSKAR